MTTTAELIYLDGRPTILLKFGPYLLGYYPSAEAAIRAMPGHGLDPADIEIDPPHRKDQPQ